MLQFPSTIGGLIIWLVAVIVIALVAVFLFANIVQPLIHDIVK